MFRIRLGTIHPNPAQMFYIYIFYPYCCSSSSVFTLGLFFYCSFYLLDLHLRIRITEVSHFADPDPKHWLKFNYHSARSL